MAAPNFTGSLIASALERGIGYAEALAKDIPADRFDHSPMPNLNHPAFNFGHLSLYPNRILNLLGKPELVVDKPGWDKLFAAGVACVEGNGQYPPKQEIVDFFLDRHRAAVAVVRETTEDVLAQPNPIEGRMREVFPRIGNAVLFMMTSHVMMHLGQISAWRRTVGLPSVM
ncbi:MAG: DinB family protein [Phycisphaerales bacterium]